MPVTRPGPRLLAAGCPRVRPNHPLANGLISVFTPMGIARAGLPFATGNESMVGGSLWGPAWVLSSAGGIEHVNAISMDAFAPSCGSVGFTIGAVFTITAAGTGNVQLGTNDNQAFTPNKGTGRYWQFRVNSARTVDAIIFNSAQGAPTTTTTTTPVAVGVEAVVSMSVATDRTPTVHVSQQGSVSNVVVGSANGTGAWATTGGLLATGFAGSAGTMTATCSAAFMWLRNLSIPEQALFAADPFALLV